MDARWNKPSTVHIICDKKSDWYNVWLNLELLAPLIIDCWIDNVKLYYDNDTRLTSNSAGVETRVPGWGDSETVMWLDPSHAVSKFFEKTYLKEFSSHRVLSNFPFRNAFSRNKVVTSKKLVML